MVMSMTGYGSDILHIGNTTVTVEIKTINNRYLDFSPKIPRFLMYLEDKMKKIIQSHFRRGRIEVYITVEGNSFVKKSVQIDWELMDQYIKQLEHAKERYNLSGELPLTLIASMPDLLSIQENDQQQDETRECIIKSVEHACKEVVSVRQGEGLFLKNDIRERLSSVQDMLSLVEGHREYVIQDYRERIQQRIKDYLGDHTDMDSSRLHQEITLLAEKGDINEEITRLYSHIEHFTKTLESSETAVGRKLDFIIQEMYRETNTIGSKSTDHQIGQWAVLLKSDMEKIKEQIQNIE